MKYTSYYKFIGQGLDESFEHIVRAQNARVDMEKEAVGSPKYHLNAAKMQNLLRHHNIDLAKFHETQGTADKATEHHTLANELHKQATENLAKFHFAKAKELATTDVDASISHQIKGQNEMAYLKKLK